MRLEKEEAAEYGSRGGAAWRKANEHVYNVEGEAVTITDIMKRIGRTKDTAKNRLKREQAKDGPVTWEGLSR